MARKKIVKEGRNVTVHYTGKLNDGTVFDSSREVDPISFEVGGGQVIAGFNEAVVGMKVGGIRRVVVPVENGYSITSSKSADAGGRLYDEPKPNTFSGKRSLDFVLKNQGLIDKTLLFDIEIISIRQ